MSDKASLALNLNNVSVGYDKKIVAKDISLICHPGSIFGLIGLNGAGKTTLIKTILGLRDELDGDISIFGDSKDSISAKERVAYLPERFSPPYFLTGLEFIQFSQSMYHQDFDIEDVLERAERLGLSEEILRARVQTYSKGMRQKLGLIATILTRCDLLILDEPMSGLDPLARTMVKDKLMSYREEGKAIFLSSHILADMDELCDNVAILHGGKIKFHGAPKDLKKNTQQKHLERAFLHCIEAA